MLGNLLPSPQSINGGKGSTGSNQFSQLERRNKEYKKIYHRWNCTDFSFRLFYVRNFETALRGASISVGLTRIFSSDDFNKIINDRVK